MQARMFGKSSTFTAALLASGLLLAVGAVSASAHGGSREHFTFTGLSAGEFYGPVTCQGVFIVDKANPGGKEIERCESNSPSGKLEGLTGGEVGSGATGGFPYPGFAGWESDDSAHAGLKTTDFSYKVNKKDTKFKLVAIY